MPTATLLKTPFHSFHTEHGAKMVEFAGWDMPLLYTSIMEEHRHCRTQAGFFDVSHMGRLRFSGRHARKFLDRICTRQIHGMEVGQCRYGLVCNERGGCLDDIIIYCFDESEYLMVCNASNRAKLLAHFEAVRAAQPDLVFKLADETETTAMVALQGPKAMEIVGSLSREIPSLKRYRFVQKNLLVVKFVVSRTGYTGEDGVEVILGASMARAAMGMFLKDVRSGTSPIRPIGLGARDTLRMEAGMPLYGHEIDEDTDPISAGLAFAVKVDKGADDERIGSFIGQEALQKIAREGPARKLVGLGLEGRRSARQGMEVRSGGVSVGRITSGCLSPTLDRPVAMGLIDAHLAVEGNSVEIDLRGSPVVARVEKLPFVSRAATT
ncbi:MAG: glycine cleavage system aminomethyltransferase GcvT [Phycisphaerales bacterium]|nr:glycine cleavage system aminomethyltransferase GcvT [Phycisphaerales bacterium]